jgi:hypothetical protein
MTGSAPTTTIGRFLRQGIEKESENKKPQIPKNKKTNRLNKREKKSEYDAPVTGTGTFLVVRERGTICASS